MATGFLMIVFFLVLFAQNAKAMTMDFEDLILGSKYYVGDIFTTSGVQITGEQFWPSSGPPTTTGQVMVGDACMANGSGYELGYISNINLRFNFGIALSGLALQYGEFGGNLNLDINGDFQNFENFADINGSTIGGTSVFAMDTNTPGDCAGALFVVGQINTFAIGGQELAIDNVVPSCIPEPMSIALLAFGSLLLRRRKK